MYDVTVIGPALVDILASPFDREALEKDSRYLDVIRMSYGGDALNESVVLSRLGKKVQLISKVGSDESGRSVLEYIKENGIETDDVIIEKELNTSINIALIGRDGSRKFLMDPDSSLRHLSLEDVLPGLQNSAQIVSFASMFISPLFTIDSMKALFSQIRAMGKTLVVDVTRAKNGEKLEDLKELLPYMDVFVPNDEEISSLTGESDPEKNVRILLDAGVKTPVVKIGGRGCLVGTQEGIFHVPSVPGVSCVDTTGAGDTFAAGFIAGLCEGRSPVDCARLGCAAASCSIEEVGAVNGVRSLDQVLDRLGRIPE